MDRSKVVGLFVVAVALLVTPHAFADDNYGMAGCGLGSMAFGDANGKFKQIIGATTNGTSGSQTFGISSGTSNCDPSKANRASLNAYIEANQLALANDVARGQGETLDSLSKILGCQNTINLGHTLQKNYSTIFPSKNASSFVVGESILNTIQEDKSLASSCNII